MGFVRESASGADSDNNRTAGHGIFIHEGIGRLIKASQLMESPNAQSFFCCELGVDVRSGR